MALPIRTTLEDIQKLCNYFFSKPTGASPEDARKVLDSKVVDGRKLSAMKFWRLLADNGGKLKVTEDGTAIAKGNGANRDVALKAVISRVPAYLSVIERAIHRKEDSLSALDVSTHWHNHHAAEVSDNDKILNDQAMCFFQVAEGAKLGKIVLGRKGQPTRFIFESSALSAFIPSTDAPEMKSLPQPSEEPGNGAEIPAAPISAASPARAQSEGIFIAHGKNKKPLEQLKKILDQFKIPYKVAVEEPNLGRPIGTKVKEVMESCSCAILIFTADEEFQNAKKETFWRPSENVAYELGAAGFLYGNRIVIMKEEDVTFPTNFRDLGHISFAKDQLESKSMDILKELLGFGLLKITT
jgi:hypothetical protein